ncbi:hypothetical protein PCANC_24611 [Puccinia coronata f. sp. avenae]|uniref:Uncharacterized protein n=1 Tax=Puccinia coronata f. sp. avenae TaxID=200324 RepID=A0A2N5UL33_9BASI|nr:hypothetical protein PCANC_24611 [Puccinia coronata f. sp. avenae]
MSSPANVKPDVSSYVPSSAADMRATPALAPPTPAHQFRLPTHHHFDVGGLPPTSIPLTAAALAPVLENIYFDSNGVLFRNGIAIVDQHGSIICRPIAECPLPVFRPTFVLCTNRAVIGQSAHWIAPPFFDPLPAFIESRPEANLSFPVPTYPRGPVPLGLESLVEHLHHNGQAPSVCNNPVASSGDVQGTRLILLRLPACITKRTTSLSINTTISWRPRLLVPFLSLKPRPPIPLRPTLSRMIPNPSPY